MPLVASATHASCDNRDFPANSDSHLCAAPHGVTKDRIHKAIPRGSLSPQFTITERSQILDKSVFSRNGFSFMAGTSDQSQSNPCRDHLRERPQKEDQPLPVRRMVHPTHIADAPSHGLPIQRMFYDQTGKICDPSGSQPAFNFDLKGRKTKDMIEILTVMVFSQELTGEEQQLRLLDLRT